MTPEREKEIRDMEKAFGIRTEVSELLEEIDRLRQPTWIIPESHSISENITIDQRFRFENEIRELKAEIERLTKLISELIKALPPSD